MKRNQPHTISIADDERARIPFALIGVLLLVSSVLVVATLETRSEPEIDRNTEVAVDRGEAYATTVIRHATVRATDEVVRSPVTSVDDGMTGVIDSDSALEDQTKLTVLAEVTRSLDGEKQDVGQGQTVEVSVPEVDDWSNSGDLADAVGYVSLEEEDGIMDVTIEDVEFTVRNEDGDIETSTTRNVTVSVGTTMMELHDRVEEYEDHLNKGTIDSVTDREGYGYDLAKRLWPLAWGKAYYDRLFSDASDRAFENVTPNDHTEVMANDARFTAQQEVFGTQDDYANRVMAGPFLCMAYDLSDSALDLDYDFDGLADDLHPDENVSSVDDLCAEGIFSPDGELPDMPTIEEIIMGILGNIDKSGTIQGHPFADMSMYEMENGLNQDDLEDEMRDSLNETERFNEEYLEDYYDDSGNNRTDENTIRDDDDAIADIRDRLNSIKNDAIFNNDKTQDAIDDVYTITASHGTTTTYPSSDGPTGHPPTPIPDSDTYDTDNLSYIGSETDESQQYVDASIDKTTRDSGDSSLDRSLVSVDVEIEMWYQTESKWNNTNTNSSPNVRLTDERTTTYSTSFEIDGEFAPDLEINPSSVEHVLDTGGSPDPYLGSPTNWEDAPDEATEAYFGEDFDSDSEFENWISPRADDITSIRGFRNAINYDSNFDEDRQLSPRFPSSLSEYIVWNDILEIHNETVNEIEPVEADVMEMLTADESPIRDLDEKVQPLEEEYVNESDDFDNAPDVARMEARQLYFNNIYNHIDNIATEHENMTTGGGNLINDLLGSVLDSANDIINGPMDLLDEMLGGAEELFQDEGGAQVDTPEVLEDVNVDVDGSPTYHSSQTSVNQSEVPAVRAAGDGPLEINESMDFAPMGTAYENEVGLPGFPLLPWPPLFYLQVDVWHIDVEGEYARFEVEATSSDPSVTDSTTYVREDKDVTLETPDGNELALGSTDPITYENSQSILVVVPAPQFLPQGAPGVGDNTFNGDVSGGQCSPLWGDIGPDFGEEDPDPDLSDCR